MTMHPYIARLRETELVSHCGIVRHITEHRIVADGPFTSVGDYCELQRNATDALYAEVVAVDGERVIMMPFGTTASIKPGMPVTRSSHAACLWAGDEFAGRAVDALGRAIDGDGAITNTVARRRGGTVPQPLDRCSKGTRVVTGIRAIDGLLPIGKGQRMGILAASGVGKTTLIDQLASQIECDHIVACLVGERGREVEKFWRCHGARGTDGGAAVTLVAATSDESAALRARAVDQALVIAEYWRDQGRHVVLMIDSITRVALALRETGLAAGEPPTVRAFTPNVFAALPRIVERCGATDNGGAITALFTVLSETDDVDDPIVEAMKSLLDGHIVLSRPIAEKGRFPAIDVARSISRLAPQLHDATDRDAAHQAHKALADYEDARAMIESGIYRAGSSQHIDAAIALHPKLIAFLAQSTAENSALADTRSALKSALQGAG